MILERIKQYIDSKGISISAFEKSIGLSNASFRTCLKKGTTIGVDKVERILNTYGDISVIWLMTGEGEMLKVRCYESRQEAIEAEEKQKKDKDALITKLTEQINVYEQQLKEKDQVISVLTKALDKAMKDGTQKETRK